MPTQAQDFTELFDFESAFETAAQTILENAGITAYISQQNVTKALIGTGISMDIGAALDELTQLAKPANWPSGQQPPQEYFRYTGSIVFTVEVPRDQNAISPVPTPPEVSKVLAQVRAKIRTAMMRVLMPFDDTNLPLYRVTDIRPNGTSTGFEAVRNIDYTSLRFDVSFLIQPTAWPAWTT